MKTVSFSVFLLVCSLLGAGDALLADEEKEEMLIAHNHYRANVQPVASNMAKLEWDDELALLAQFWAVSCRLKSNEDRHEQSSKFDYVGEILAASTNSTVNLTVMVGEWFSQGANFNYSRATCGEDENKVNKDDKNKENSCGKYLQLVWASTYKVGCSTHRCEEIKGLDEEIDEDVGALLMICNYGPGGGYVDEQPYESGDDGVCSSCPVYFPYCEENLCSATGGATTLSKIDISITGLLLLLFTAATTSAFHFPG